MALTLGTYFLNRFRPDMKERLVDVTDLVVEKALIPHSQGPQLLRTSAKINWASKSANLVFYSINVSCFVYFLYDDRETDQTKG
jgi:hypothetical protein